MLYGFIGRVTPAEQLKEALDIGATRTRLIADRVSKASLNDADGFALPIDGTPPGSEESGAVDVEAEMASLADQQLRFEATARLLQKAYDHIRTSIRSR
jgi:flagellar basal body rod protein FlgB